MAFAIDWVAIAFHLERRVCRERWPLPRALSVTCQKNGASHDSEDSGQSKRVQVRLVSFLLSGSRGQRRHGTYSRHAFAFLSGVFLLMHVLLMIQIVQTRILSVVSLYYMAFFSIAWPCLGSGRALIVYYKLDNVTPGTSRLPVEDIDRIRIGASPPALPGACISLPNLDLGDFVVLGSRRRAARGAVHGRRYAVALA